MTGIGGVFMSRLIYDTVTGRLKETEVARAIDLREIVVSEEGMNISQCLLNAQSICLVRDSAFPASFQNYPVAADKLGPRLHQARSGTLNPPGHSVSGCNE